MSILAVSGSLQERSANAAILRAVAESVRGRAEVRFSRALHELPPFNADLDGDEPIPAVAAWRAELAAADAVVIATPEYAFGIAGALKNSLDWVVGSGELVNKRVALIGASTMETGASYALEALERTIRVMSADVVATLSVAHTRAKIDPSGAVVDPPLLESIREIAERLIGFRSQ